MTSPRLIVGLGNPGSEYADNRHNLGFWFIERLASDLKVSLTPQGKFFGVVARVGELSLLQLMPEEILVVHDDLDLQPGGIRLKNGGGNGGHNGLRDIQAHLSTPDFWRLRVGIGHPGERSEVVNFVLQAPRREERELIDHALDRCRLAWSKLSAGDYAAAQRLLHSKAT